MDHFANASIFLLVSLTRGCSLSRSNSGTFVLNLYPTMKQHLPKKCIFELSIGNVASSGSINLGKRARTRTPQHGFIQCFPYKMFLKLSPLVAVSNIIQHYLATLVTEVTDFLAFG